MSPVERCFLPDHESALSWSGKLAFDHAKRVFNFGPYLRFRIFNLAPHTTNQTLFSVLFIAAWPGGNRPDHPTILMLGTLVHAGVTGIARDVSFLAMQQLIDLSHVRHIRRRTHYAMHQTGFSIDTDVRFHPEIVLISFNEMVSPARETQ